MDYWKITIKYPDNNELSDRWREIWVNRKDTAPKKIYYHVVYQRQEETKEWDIDSMVFDKVTPASLESRLKSKMASYTVAQYTPPPPGYYNLLDSGSKAPAFSGQNFQTGKGFALSQCMGKVTVLDFWYMDCPWCVKAMPDLEKVQNDYKNKGLVVLGINSFDTTDKAKARLPDFRSINKMNYDVILTSRKTDSLYKIKVYPTLYVIDKKGRVAYTHLGYKANLDSTLNLIIPKELAK